MHPTGQAALWDDGQRFGTCCLNLIDVRYINLVVIGTLGVGVSLDLGFSGFSWQDIEDLHR